MEYVVSFINSEASRTILIYSLAICLGALLEKIKIWGISLGPAMTLIAAIILKTLGASVSKEHIEFARDFGLALFVYALGYQLGPGFLNSLKKEGIKYNSLAFLSVALSVAAAILIYFFFEKNVSLIVGILSGAVTNTPGLGAAQQTAKDLLTNPEIALQNLGLGYAIVYPFGVAGIIFSILIVKIIFRINIQNETRELEQKENKSTLVRTTYKVTNDKYTNMTLEKIRTEAEIDFIISRIKRNENVFIPTKDTIIFKNDLVSIVADKEASNRLKEIFGEITDIDITKNVGEITTRKIIVTNKEAIGKKLSELDYPNKFGARLTRIYRMGIELLPTGNTVLQFGDIVRVVGDDVAISEVMKNLGHSQKKLYEPNPVPIFLGITAGIFVGSIPIYLPGLPAPFKFGIAGGVILSAIVLSQLSARYSLKNYMTPGANLMLRELGILMFLVSVGLNVGSDYFAILFSLNGVKIIIFGLAITMLPLIATGIFARAIFKLNFLRIAGILAGSTTDPPALAYAQKAFESDIPAISFAGVYPFTMLLRIISAQLLIIAFL